MFSSRTVARTNARTRRGIGLAVATLLIANVNVARAQNWPSFRGSNASGVAVGKPTPTTWDGTKGTNILWKMPIPGLAHASPVVWGDRVFVTTAVSSQGKQYFRHGLYGDVDTDKDVNPHLRVYALDHAPARYLDRWLQECPGSNAPSRRLRQFRRPNRRKARCAFFGSEVLTVMTQRQA